MSNSKPLGLILSILSSVFARLSGFATQVITAWYLTQDDFGIYAIAVGITTITLIMRGGGTGIIYQTMRPEEYAQTGGALLRISLIFALIGGLLTAGSAMPAMGYFDQPELGWLLLWMAILSILTHISNYPRAKMGSSLLFKELAMIDLVASIAKLVIAFFCARAGFGALTFVYAQILAVCLQLAAMSFFARFSRTDFAVVPNWLSTSLPMLKYPFWISVLITLTDQVDSFVASFFVPLASLGVYFFAVQLVVQPTRLITGTIGSVLAPITARSRGDRRAESQQIIVAFKTGAVFAPLMVLFIAAIFPSTQRLLWQDKWEGSTLPVMFACFFLIYPTIQWVLEGPIIGLRRWTTYISLLSWRAASKVVGILLAVAAIKIFSIPDESLALTLVIGVGVISSVTAFLQIRKVVSEFHLERDRMNAELFLTPAYAILAVIGTQGVIASIMQHFHWVDDRSRSIAAVELVMTTLVYGAISLTLLRFAYLQKLKVVLAVLPAPAKRLICKLIVLPQSELENLPPLT